MRAEVIIKQLVGEDPPAVVFVTGSEQLSHEDTVLLTRLTEHHGSGWSMTTPCAHAPLPTTDLIVVSSPVSLAKVRRRHALRDAYDIGDTRADGTTADARAIGWFLGERGWDDLTDHGASNRAELVGYNRARMSRCASSTVQPSASSKTSSTPDALPTLIE